MARRTSGIRWFARGAMTFTAAWTITSCDGCSEGLNRAAALLDMSVAEVRNRATVTGAIEIGRLPGVIQVTFLAPLANLEQAGLLPFAKEAYNFD